VNAFCTTRRLGSLGCFAILSTLSIDKNALSANLSSSEKPLQETIANKGSGTSSYTIDEDRETVDTGPWEFLVSGGVA